MKLLAGIWFVLLWAGMASASVVFGGFTAVPLEDRIEFRWRTESENVNYFFQLYRDGERWSPNITGYGTTNVPQDYEWTDTTALTGEIHSFILACFGGSGYDSLAGVVIAAPHWVALSVFGVSGGPDQVSMLWQTRSEIENQRFEISRDGVVLDSVAAHNRYVGSYYYAWSDSTALPDVGYWYTLWAVEEDGRRDSLASGFAMVTAVDDPAPTLPQDFSLAAYPNPFNPATSLVLEIPWTSQVRLTVFDILGRELRVLADRPLEAGSHRFRLDAAGLPSGLYFARAEGRGFSTVCKLHLTK